MIKNIPPCNFGWIATNWLPSFVSQGEIHEASKGTSGCGRNSCRRRAWEQRDAE